MIIDIEGQKADLLSKAAEYEFRAALVQTEAEAMEERMKFNHFRRLAECPRYQNMIEDQILDRADARARAADKTAQEQLTARRRRKLGLPAEGFDDQFEEGEKTVVDPYELKPLAVKVNKRRDILEFELSHSRITPEQKAAGDMLQALFDRAEVGGAQAIDYQTPKVDSCAKGDPLSDSVIAANQRLEEVEAHVGKDDYRLLRLTLIGGRTMKDIALQQRGPFPSKSAKYDAEKYVGMRWRDALTSLVDYFGVAPKPVEKPKLRVHVSERSTHRPETWENHHVPLHFGATG